MKEKNQDILLKSIKNLEILASRIYDIADISPEAKEEFEDRDIDNIEWKEFSNSENAKDDPDEFNEEFDEDDYWSEEEKLVYSTYYQEFVPENYYVMESDFKLSNLSKSIYKLLYYYDIIEKGNMQMQISRIQESFLDELVYNHLDSFNIEPEFIENQISNLIDYTDFATNYRLFKKSIPENINELTNEIIYHFSKYPELIHQIQPRLFEELINKIFKKFKLKPEITKHTRDGGMDIIAFEDRVFTKHKYIIECKKYKPENKIGVDIVRSLYGVKNDFDATKAFLVTTSSFTKPAKQFANRHPWELELIDSRELQKWISLLYKK